MENWFELKDALHSGAEMSVLDMGKKVIVCLCVCTRKRPLMLDKLIASFVALKVPELIEVSLEVVENNELPEVEDLVIARSRQTNKKIFYHFESRVGIPVARNRCIDVAIEKAADYIAFVDDDEWLFDDWLLKIWEFCGQIDSDAVVQGAVIAKLPDGTPNYMLNFFQPKIKVTGTSLHVCATNNVLVPVSVVREYGLRFDESRPLAGGTDAKLFRYAYSLGVKMYYCAEARVCEEIHSERITYAWMSKRYFRVGLSVGAHRQMDSLGAWMHHVFSLAYRALVYCLKAIVYYVLFNKRKHMHSWLKCCRMVGELLGPFGVNVDSYRRINGM